MLKYSILPVIVLLMGCASTTEVHYTVPAEVVYIKPYYPAPGPNWHWVYHSRMGWCL